MLELRRDLDLGQEALGPNDDGQLGLEDFEGYLAFVLEVVRQENRSHSAFAKLTLYAVAALQGDVEADGWIGHAGQDASKACGAARISDT